MEVALELNGTPKTARVVFAVRDDLAFIQGWREKLGHDINPYRKDAVDFAALAIQRFEADSEVGQPYVQSVSDILDHVSHDPQCEVAGFLLLTSDWFPDSNVLGICHFRRTFCNNIVLDYLAGHPFTVRPPENYQYSVRGVGTALMCVLSTVAVSLGCAYIWGEATSISRKFYRRVFRLDSIEDLILVPKSSFTECARLDLSWQKTKDATMKPETIEEIYKIEEANPPLVGNRTLMTGPRRQLVNHFLDLPRYVQDEIAKTLGLLTDGDENVLEIEWCPELFRRATQEGKLAQLWDEVEKRHEDGEPEKKPFGS
jgi:hypothetical protein